MMYLYAITDQTVLSSSCGTGLDNAPLCHIRYQELGATVSAITTTQVEATETHLWQHEAVVEKIMVHHTVLPVRFGTVLADENAVYAALVAHYVSFKADLERLRNHVELGLRVLWSPAALISGNRYEEWKTDRSCAVKDGREYLLARLQEERQMQCRHQQAEALADVFHVPLAQLAVDSTRRILVAPCILLTGAYLVNSKDIAAFLRCVRDLSLAYPSLQCICTGPWPAYSFVTGVSLTTQVTS